MGYHGDKLRFHLIEFLEVTDILQYRDGSHDFAQIVADRGCMGPEKHSPGVADTQFLRYGCVSAVFSLETVFYGS